MADLDGSGAKRVRPGGDDASPPSASGPALASAAGAAAPSVADVHARFADVDRLLRRPGPFVAPVFEPEGGLEMLQSAPVLVIGAGGLGCELVKNLALSGVCDITLIDMDTVDVSNLNRQFLFRAADVGRPKAVVAAEFINKRVPGAAVKPVFGRVEEQSRAFYQRFAMVLCGLDSLVARRWANGLVHSMLRYEAGDVDPSSVVPLVDGGTEGFLGQVKVVVPGQTACMECIVGMFPPPVTYPLCTIASTPRQPEHCVEYASVVMWPNEMPDVALDADNPEHVQWVHERALARAAEFGIGGITMRLVTGVLKRVVPAIASTNAAIAAGIAHETLKLATGVAPSGATAGDFMGFNGLVGCFTHTFSAERIPDCTVCGRAKPLPVTLERSATVQELVEYVAQLPRLQLQRPTLFCALAGGASRTLYASTPAAMQVATADNLTRPIHAVVGPDAVLSASGTLLVHVTDPALHAVAIDLELAWR